MKLINCIKRNKKFVIGFALGLVISSGTVYAVTLFDSLDVSYDNSTSGLSATNVKDALDELYEKSDTLINIDDMGTPTNYDVGTSLPTTDSPTAPPANRTTYMGLYADGQYGICVKIDGVEHCFRANNWIAEKQHAQNVSNGACTLDESMGLWNCSFQLSDKWYNIRLFSDGRTFIDNGERCFIVPDGRSFTASC